MISSTMLTLPAICLVGLLLTLPMTQAQEKRPPRPMSGNWTNFDADTRGLTRLQIVEDRGELQILAWGKCHPTDCAWGGTKLHLLGDDVEAKKLPYGLATWEKDFATTHLTLKQAGGELIVQCHTLFKDGSGRENYRNEYRFKRAK